MVRHLGVGLGSTVIANLIGGAIFFWVDRFIFTSRRLEVWHLKEKLTELKIRGIKASQVNYED